MKKYEYKHSDDARNHIQFADIANEYGQEGWQCINFERINGLCVALFMREIENKD